MCSNNKTRYIINRKTHERYSMNGFVTCEEESITIIQPYINNHFHPKPLPRRIDLRRRMTPVENQQKTNSCTANALAGAYEYLLKQKLQENIDISRLFIYYNSRVKAAQEKKIPANKIADKGCSINMSVTALKELGTCLEDVWPYDLKAIDTRPSDLAYQKAKDELVALDWKPISVKIDLNDMKLCLAKGFPFVFGLHLFESFRKQKDGRIEMPKPGDDTARNHGKHAMLAVGYNDDEQVFIVRNSWGQSWGRLGHCFIPYEYLANAKYAEQAWAVCSGKYTNKSRNPGDSDSFGADGDDDDGAGEWEEEDLFDDNYDDEEYDDGYDETQDDDDDWDYEEDEADDSEPEERLNTNIENGFPADDGEFPADSGEFPVDDDESPVDDGGFPADGGEFPLDDGGFPADGGEFSVDTSGFPGDGGEFPAEEFEQ